MINNFLKKVLIFYKSYSHAVQLQLARQEFRGGKLKECLKTGRRNKIKVNTGIRGKTLNRLKDFLSWKKKETWDPALSHPRQA